MQKFIKFIKFRLFVISIFSAQLAYCNWPYEKPVDLSPYTYLIVDKDDSEDLVLRLLNGSLWKVSPNHQEIYDQWQIGETVHVGYQRGFQLSKKEYMCSLYNHDRNEEVHAFLFYSPIKLEELSDSFPLQYNSAQLLTLGDRTNWLFVYRNFFKTPPYVIPSFFQECPVHICVNQEKGENVFYLILGEGMDSKILEVYLLD